MEKYDLNEGNDAHKRVLLMMKYDTNKTLSENTQQILTEATVSPIKKLIQSLIGLSDDVLETVTTKTKPELQNILNKTRRTIADDDEIFKSIKDFPSLAVKLFKNNSIFTPIQQKTVVNAITDAISLDSSKFSTSVNLITDALMGLGKFPNSAKPLIEEYSKLIIKNDVKQTLRIKYPEVYSKLFKAKGIVKKLSDAEAKNLSPKTIKWWERVLSTDKTILDILKGWTDDAVNRLILKNQGNQKYIDNLFSKLQQATEDSINKLKRGEKADITLLRNINTNVRVLADKYKADSDAIYDELGELLNKKYPGRFKEIDDIINQIKKNNPFQTDPPRWGALTQFLNNTATSKLMGNLRKGIFGKERTKEWSEFFERTVSLLGSGAPKSIQEWSSYFQRGTPGLIELYRDLWVALHVGMPITLSFFSAFFNLIGIPAFGNDTEASSFMEDWGNKILKRYQNMITGWSKFGLILPIHPYGYDIYQFTNDVYAEKYSYVIDDTMTSELNKLSNEELSKYQGYDPNKSRIENIRSIVKIAKQNALKNLKGDNSKVTPEDIKTNAKQKKTEIEKNIINIQKDVKPAVPCLFTGGWTVELTTLNGIPTYVTHNADWSQKYYLDITKKDNVTTVYYQGTTQYPC